MISYSNHLGTITISKKYLTKLVTSLAESCFGVSGLNGVEIVEAGEAVDIVLKISAAESVNLPAVSNAVSHKVSYELTKGGVNVRSIKIYTDALSSTDI
ncbi:MAG: hypothetical protein K6B74_05255 [Ruminococcus sp.]|nr:hypothetical protein [Ruminococcus sp.]